MSIIENYNRIRERVDRAAAGANRDPREVKIIAVSKTFPSEIIQRAIDSGITLFGENKIQEAKNKIPELRGESTFHMIGHLQSNKAKDAVKLFDVIHSIDKPGTALKVSNEAEKLDKVQKILIQVNSSGEESKSGVDPDNAINIVKEISNFSNVEIIGIMAMARFTDNMEIIRDSFKVAREVLCSINTKLNMDLTDLSMGMSSDYEIAVEEGATLIRVGSAIFGKRTYI